MIGNKFGRLTVLEELKQHNGKQNISYLRCICDCGNEKLVRTASIKRGKTKSCGCWRIELMGMGIMSLVVSGRTNGRFHKRHKKWGAKSV
jgi:hypothetical protein